MEKTNTKYAMFDIIAVLAIFLTLQAQQQAYASGGGYNAGKNDRMDGLEYNSTCPPGTSDGQCVIYKAAYFAGWNAEGILHGNDQPRYDYDFTDRDAQDARTNEDDDDN